MDKGLDDIFIKYGTDKSSLSHNYTPFYEKHLPKQIGNFLEVGAWKGAGIKSFKDWYGGIGKFFAMDRFLDGHGLITVAELQALGVNSYVGSHDDMWFLESIKEKFSCIIDDGSHHWDSQINMFRRMFPNNIEPGGWYIIEDVFDELYWGRGVIKKPEENIEWVLKRHLKDGYVHGELIDEKEGKLLSNQIDEIHFYKNIIFVKKNDKP